MEQFECISDLEDETSEQQSKAGLNASHYKWECETVELLVL